MVGPGKGAKRTVVRKAGGGAKGGKGAKGKKVKGGKGGKGRGSGPKRLRLGDDISLDSSAEMSGAEHIEDDESIPDDDAFDSEDEKRFGSMLEGLSGGKKGGKGKEKPSAKAKKATGVDDADFEYGTDEEIDPDYSSSDGSEDGVKLSDLLDEKLAPKATRKKSKGVLVESQAEGALATSSMKTEPLSLDALISSTVAKAEGLTRMKKKLAKLQERGDGVIDKPEETHMTNARERELTREALSKDLGKWNKTVHSNRVKDFSQFPLPEPIPEAIPTTANIGERVEPTTEMEKEIDGLLKESGLRTEVPKDKEIDPSDFIKLEGDVYKLATGGEEDKGTLGKLKSVLRYEFQKRRRIKHIKSSEYRRMLRKEREKQKEKRLELLALVDPEAAIKKRREEMMKARAAERMGLRHKNKSQWVRHVKSMAKWDPSTRAAIQEQNRIHQKLIQKADEDIEKAGFNKADDDSDSSDMSEGEKEIDTLLQDSSTRKSALWELRNKVKEDGGEKTGLWGMKFMKRAEEKRQEDMMREIDELEEDMEAYDQGKAPRHMLKAQGVDVPADAEPEGEGEGNGSAVQRKKKAAVGKMKFAGQTADDKKAVATVPVPGKDKGFAAPTDDVEGGEDEDSKPRKGGTQVSEEELKVSLEGVNASVVTERQRRLKLRKELARQKAERASQAAAVQEKSTAGKKRRRGEGDEEAAAPAKAAEDEPETEGTTAAPAKKKKLKKKMSENKENVLVTADGMEMDQDYLIARSFAADTLLEEFQKEKEAEIAKDATPIDEQLALPGWGEWGGNDPSLGEKQRSILAKMKADQQKEIDELRAKRKDRKLDNVIIHETSVPSKYSLSKLPFPYRSEEQLEAVLSTPIGGDWNTETRTRAHLRPKMKTKAGEIIAPIEKEQGARKAPKTKRRKMKRKADDGADSD
eukprot:Sspe_Gene.16862::Locus_5961_Transcript_1_1_Confidence_1.000_Length_2987::g.16862::m.16862/K14567/UTP14; U3 small nucleolar RNA-associated protein 14